MTRFFYDTEFHEDGSTIDFLSLGMVNDTDQTERYWINYDFDFARVPAGHWIEANVYPHLPVRQVRRIRESEHVVEALGSRWTWDLGHPDAQYLRVRAAIAGELRAYITSYGVNRREHELWAYFGAYDHLALCQLYGPMIALPSSIPMFTHDLMQLVKADPSVWPKQCSTGEHFALADARWNREVWRWWQTMVSTPRAALHSGEPGKAPTLLYGAKSVQLDVKGTPLPDVLALIDAVRGLPTPTLDDILAKTRGTEFAAQLIKVHG